VEVVDNKAEVEEVDEQVHNLEPPELPETQLTELPRFHFKTMSEALTVKQKEIS
jgi:hypothetical protein